MKYLWFLLVCLLLSCASSDPQQTIKFVASNQDTLCMIELGHHLFFDKKLSRTNEKSCATCHNPLMAFTDGYKVGRGIYGGMVKHNTPTVLNLENNHYFNWSDSTLHTVLQQMNGPMFNINPPELGLDIHKKNVLNRFNKDPLYIDFWYDLFANKSPNYDFNLVKECINLYILTLQARHSNFDLFRETQDSFLLPKSALKGMLLFYNDKKACYKCHGGVDFDEPSLGSTFAVVGIHTDRLQSNPKKQFISDVDTHYYKIPSLRNCVLTSPYFHDGSEADLRFTFHNLELEQTTESILKRDPRLTKSILSDVEIDYIIDFLHELTDTSYLRQKEFIDPFIY